MDASLLILLGLSLLVPMALLAFVSTRARVTCFVLGLMTGFGVEYWIDPGGHDPRGFISYLGFAVALAAVLVEVAAFAMRRMRRRESAGAGTLPDG